MNFFQPPAALYIHITFFISSQQKRTKTIKMQTPSILLALLLAATVTSSCVPVAAASSTASTLAPQATSTTFSNTTASISTTNFGTCSPAMDFQLGRAAFNRKATEGTFLPTDPVVAKGQQDALNPNIITNRICDQLTNVCGASQVSYISTFLC